MTIQNVSWGNGKENQSNFRASKNHATIDGRTTLCGIALHGKNFCGYSEGECTKCEDKVEKLRDARSN